MKNKQFYTCEYCYKEFEPKRRRVQKYCSDTCRSKAYHARKTKTLIPIETNNITVPKISNPQKPKMSLGGVGNATAGTLAADAIKSLLTKASNKPATKGDLSQLVEKLNGRYHLVKNMNPNAFGQYPYFDLIEGVVVYLK
ncbi:hypothetical protein [Winogradskyella sp. PC D3.3]